MYPRQLKKLGLLSLIGLSAWLAVTTHASASVIYPVDAHGHYLPSITERLIQLFHLCGIPLAFAQRIVQLLESAFLLVLLVFLLGLAPLNLLLKLERKSQIKSKPKPEA